MPALRDCSISRAVTRHEGAALLPTRRTSRSTSKIGRRRRPSRRASSSGWCCAAVDRATQVRARCSTRVLQRASASSTSVQCALTDERDAGGAAEVEAPRGAGGALARREQAGSEAAFGEARGLERAAEARAVFVVQVTSAAELQALFPKPSKSLRALELASAKDLAKTPSAISGCAESFTELDIGTTSIGDAGWDELFSSGSLDTLLELHANGCSLSDDSVEVLTQSKLRRLVTLDLSSNKLTDDGLELLANWQGLEHVTHLRLGNNRKVTSAGLRRAHGRGAVRSRGARRGQVERCCVAEKTARQVRRRASGRVRAPQ